MVPEASCRYCVWMKPHELNDEAGECRRLPPDASSGFPDVKLDDEWCGEYFAENELEPVILKEGERPKEKTSKWKFWNILRIHKKTYSGGRDYLP